jgi:hypothetical protein
VAIEAIVKVAVCPFFKVTFLATLVVEIAWFPNDKLLGETVTV